MIDKTKALLFERQAEIAKAVAHPLRIAVLDFLKDGEKWFARSPSTSVGTVERLAALTLMVRCGVLSCRKDGLKSLLQRSDPLRGRLSSAVPAGCSNNRPQDNEKLWRHCDGRSRMDSKSEWEEAPADSCAFLAFLFPVGRPRFE